MWRRNPLDPATVSLDLSAPELSPAESAALLARAQAGDEAAFGQLMQLHYEPVFRVIYAVLRNEHDARDVAQEVWLKIWQELPKFRGDSKFTTWVHPIAVRRSLDLVRKRRRWFDRFLPFSSAAEEFPSVAEPSTDHTARDETESDERARGVRTAIDELPPKQRAVLVLRELEGLSYEEIAAGLSLPIGTVMSRLYHARRSLAQKLKKSP